MYGNPYYNTQTSMERIDNQIKELEAMRSHLQKPPMQPSINQTFQLAPGTNPNGIKYANSIEEVGKELVFSDTPFLNKEHTIMWIKNTKGEIRTYEIKELVQKDEKDLIIEDLMSQIETLKKGMTQNAEPVDDNIDEPDKK